MKRQICICAMALLAFGCVRDIKVNDQISKAVKITASFADYKTKTILPDSGTSVYWEQGDEIMVFSGEEGSRFTSILAAPAAVSEFSGILPDGAEDLLAIYPYDGDATCDGVAITTTLPDRQDARDGSFASDLNLSMAESNSLSMDFYNVCGGLCFSLETEGVRKVTLTSSIGEPLAGKIKLAFENGVPVVQDVIDGKDSITLYAPDNGTFTTGEMYYIVTLPVAMSSGFKMKFETDTKYATLKSSSLATISRSVFGRVKKIDADLIWKNLDGTSGENIVFKDASVKKACVAKFDTDNDGEISYEEASAVTDLTSLSFSYTDILSFEELVYFDNISVLPSNFFYYCKKLKSVSIPSSVTKIDAGCFGDCSSLTNIEIPSSVTELGRTCFSSCTSLTNIAIPSSVTSLGSGCFIGCSSLTGIEIPSSVTKLSQDCFYGCGSLTNIEIPSSVTEFGRGCFGHCSSLTSIEIPSSVTIIGYQCFYGCTSLNSIIIPTSVTSLGEQCFKDCTSLKSIEIPSSVTTLDCCFYGCTSLTSIIIPSSVVSLGDYCFYNCQSLTDFEIPSSVTSLGRSCFYGCISITSIDIPSSVTSMGTNSFRDCTKLSTMRCYAATVPTLGSSVFYNTMANNLYVPEESIVLYKNASQWSSWTNILKLE